MDWPTLANIIREVDGNHDLGAGELAERILTHPRFQQPVLREALDPATVIEWLREALGQDEEWASIARSIVTVKARLAALADPISSPEPHPCADCGKDHSDVVHGVGGHQWHPTTSPEDKE